MQIIEITQEEFESYELDKNPAAGLFLNERYWFRNDNHNLVGTIVFDNSDGDWGYVIMAKESDGMYRAFDFKHSMDEQEALALLHLNMHALSKADSIEDTLYKDVNHPLEVEGKFLIKNIDLEIKQYFRKHPEKLHELSSRKFEELVASILQDFGFGVELTRATRDGGSDIIAHLKNAVTTFLMLVECKRYALENKVGVGIIREVIGVHHIKNPAKSIIVTTSTFTKDAQNQANEPSVKGLIELHDYYNLKNWLNKY